MQALLPCARGAAIPRVFQVTPEWPAVLTCGRSVDEAREILPDAAREMIAPYRDEGREPPIGGGHSEQITIDLAAA
jgi:predicted RNase H-like HicB family nuclease